MKQRGGVWKHWPIMGTVKEEEKLHHQYHHKIKYILYIYYIFFIYI